MIKVLHTLDSLNRGGAGIMTLDVCRNARANGLDLTFLATGGGDLEEDFRRSDFEYVRLERKLPIDPQLVSQIRQIVRKREIQIVHSHQPVEALHMYLATRNSGIKRVLTVHGPLSGVKNELAFRYVINRTDGVVAISRELQTWLKGNLSHDTNGNVPLIKNGVDLKRLQSHGDDLRSELNLPRETQLAGMIANFRPGMAERENAAGSIKACAFAGGFAGIAREDSDICQIFLAC